MNDEGTTQVDSLPVDSPAGESAPQADPQASMLDALRGAMTDGEPEQTVEGDAGAEGAEGATGERARGPDGRYIKKEGEADPQAKAADPAEPKPQAKPDAKPDVKPTDDALREPEGLKPEAAERFRTLVSMVRERDEQLEQVRTQAAEVQQAAAGFQKMIVDTGATDQEILALFDFARAVKHGDWQSAAPMLAHLTQQYRVAVGSDPAGSDPLAHHPDLAQAVQAGQMTMEAARQVLQARQVLARQQEAERAAQAENQTQAQYVEGVKRATADVAGLVQGWSRTDLDWPKKQAMLQQHAVEIAKTMHPSQWVFALQSAYKLIGETLAASAPQRTPPGPNTPQPLRPSAANAGRREPANMQEAIAAALGGSA